MSKSKNKKKWWHIEKKLLDNAKGMKIMVLDIETAPKKAWVWGCGKQRISPGQLVDEGKKFPYDVISATWMFNDGSKPTTVDWGWNKQDSSYVSKKLDDAIKKAQDKGVLIFGKNNSRFDNKHIATFNMIREGESFPEWIQYTRDLETLLRKHFYLPSYSLDYISGQLGYGGKIKMQLQDWVDIVEKRDPKKLGLMNEYGAKDVVDTMKVLLRVLPYVTLKNPMLNPNKCKPDPDASYAHLSCNKCDGDAIKKNGHRGGYQYFYCNDCQMSAGKAAITKKGQFGNRML